MANGESVFTVRDYGRIALRLKALMDERRISRGALARSTNTRFEVIDKWYNGEVAKIDMDVLARICFVLKCEPGDILTYTRE